MLSLSAYLSEFDRWRGKPLVATLLDLIEQHALETAIVLRGSEGVGRTGRWSTDRFETRSFDLPLLATVVDEPERMRPLLDELRADPPALLTVERRLRVTRAADLLVEQQLAQQQHAKLTVYCDGAVRIDEQAAALALVDELRTRGLAGATVLRGLDGVLHRTRQSRHLFSASHNLPVAIVAIDEGSAVAAALTTLPTLAGSIAIVSPIRMLKRNGVQLAPLDLAEDADDSTEPWQKLTIYTRQRDRTGRRSFYPELVRQLLRAEASGVTVFHGVWGYGSGHQPHGLQRFSIREQPPVVTQIVDRASAIARLWPIIDQATSEAGVVTSEPVDAAPRAQPRRSRRRRSFSRLGRAKRSHPLAETVLTGPASATYDG